MTTKDGADLTGETPDRRARGRIRLDAGQRKAINFLRSRNTAAAKVLVGAPGTGKTTLLRQICAERGDHTVLCASGGGATNSFMTSLLRGAGLESEGLCRTEQESLLTVFLEHEKAKGKRVLIAVDAAERLNEAEWLELERLHTLQLENRSSIELIVAGRPEIYKRIRSPVDGWQHARTRLCTLGIKEEPADGPEPPQLIVSHDGAVLGRYRLKSRTLIGRNVHNDICLKHPGISRHHAVAMDTPNGYYVVDLNSKNGLEVNGERVTSAVLRHGDVMTLGVYRIKVMAWGRGTPGDPRPDAPSLSATATLGVKGLRTGLSRGLGEVEST